MSRPYSLNLCYNLCIIIITPRLDSLGVYIIDNTSLNNTSKSIPTLLSIYEFGVNSTTTFSFKINATSNIDRSVMFLIGNGNGSVYAVIAVYTSAYFVLKTLTGLVISPSSALSGNTVTITTVAWDRCWVLSERALG